MSEQGQQSRFDRGDDVVVMKFGGTSVEDATAIRRLVDIVESRIGEQPVVVVSALARVTDQLLEAGHAAASGHLGAALAAVRQIYVRHEQLADSLIGGSAYNDLDRHLRGDFQALEALLLDLAAAGVLDCRNLDRLLGFGECFSSKLVCDALRQSGFEATHVDARSCIVTDDRHGQAGPVWDVTNQRLQETLSPLLQAGRIPVLGGFIGATEDGAPTTLGRGGSDFTASIVGAALAAARIEIWTDVDGVMTADPRLCSEARVIRRMSFEEAAELAHCGAKVLHPATIAPAMRENIPVHVLNSRRPESDGTEIVARGKSGKPATAVTAKKNVAAVEIESAHGINSALLDAVFSAFAKHSHSIDITAASLGRVLLLVDGAAPLPAISAQLRDIANVRWEDQRALVSLVGENIRRQPELASRVFATVADMDVRMLFQGASDRSISFLVDESKVEDAVQRLHALFFPKPEPLPDWGGISSAFCQAR
jgi:aspartate kinase